MISWQELKDRQREERRAYLQELIAQSSSITLAAKTAGFASRTSFYTALETYGLHAVKPRPAKPLTLAERLSRSWG